MSDSEFEVRDGADEVLEGKFQRAEEILRSLHTVVVAFSGGVDSTFVLKAAVEALGPARVIAATSCSDSVPETERAQATDLAALVGAEHVLVHTDEFANPDYLANPTNRCYFCKSTLYTHLERLRVQRGFAAIVNGTNADDLGDWRPGLEAAREFQVRSPAAEAGLTKQEIRRLSQRLGLPTFDKPASPCLSSRVPYGQAITPEKLERIDHCERFLRDLGFRECRVRHYEELARIEVPVEELSRLVEVETRTRVEANFRAAGFRYVTVDLRGLRSGSLNDVIPLNLAAVAASRA